jgi:hypothetical protein
VALIAAGIGDPGPPPTSQRAGITDPGYNQMLPRMPRVGSRGEIRPLTLDQAALEAPRHVIPREGRADLVFLVIQRDVILDLVELFPGVFFRRRSADAVGGGKLFVGSPARVRLGVMVFSPVFFLRAQVDWFRILARFCGCFVTHDWFPLMVGLLPAASCSIRCMPAAFSHGSKFRDAKGA